MLSDRGGEYESPFVDLCVHNGIIHETTTPYSPQSNGVAKQKKTHFKRDNECNANQLWFTTKHVGRSSLDCSLPFE